MCPVPALGIWLVVSLVLDWIGGGCSLGELCYAKRKHPRWCRIRYRVTVGWSSRRFDSYTETHCSRRGQSE